MTSLTYQPINPHKAVKFSQRKSFRKALYIAFGDYPMVLSEDDMQILRGIAASGMAQAGILIEAISEHGSVEVDER